MRGIGKVGFWCMLVGSWRERGSPPRRSRGGGWTECGERCVGGRGKLIGGSGRGREGRRDISRLS